MEIHRNIGKTLFRWRGRWHEVTDDQLREAGMTLEALLDCLIEWGWPDIDDPWPSAWIDDHCTAAYWGIPLQHFAH